MKLTSYYPVICTENVAATQAFYETHFGFRAVFAADWYVHLTLESAPGVNLAVLDSRHTTIPEDFRASARGLLLNLEVEDVDAEYERLRDTVPVQLALRDEPFGQRHFIAADPNGVLIDVITPIPPSAEFAALYHPEALPS
ncbi:VOC family protein [Rhodospirillaceae bacterium SYSU D60014]|uniref:VOC family protein n=1 Tax=Virgifigura deserti TaxID=2268457 RepID=UPI000E66B2B1